MERPHPSFVSSQEEAAKVYKDMVSEEGAGQRQCGPLLSEQVFAGPKHVPGTVLGVVNAAWLLSSWSL